MLPLILRYRGVLFVPQDLMRSKNLVGGSAIETRVCKLKDSTMCMRDKSLDSFSAFQAVSFGQCKLGPFPGTHFLIPELELRSVWDELHEHVCTKSCCGLAPGFCEMQGKVDTVNLTHGRAL